MAKTIEQLDAELKKLRRKVFRLVNQRTKLIEQKNTQEMPDPLTPKFLMSLNWPQVTGKIHEVISAWLQNTYYGKGVYYQGYYPGTNQIALEVMFYQDKPFEDQLGILDFVQYIKSIDGKKTIGVFEHTLSSYAAYTIQGSLKDGWELIATTSGRSTTKTTTPSLMLLLKYVYKNHPYEKSSST